MGACCSSGEAKPNAPAKADAAGARAPEPVKPNDAAAPPAAATAGDRKVVDTKDVDLSVAASASDAAEKKQRDDAFAALYAPATDATPALAVDEKVAEANAARWETLNSVLRAHQMKLTADAQKAVEANEAELGLTAADDSKTDADSKETKETNDTTEFDAKAVDAQTERYLKALDKSLAAAQAASGGALDSDAQWAEVFNGYDLNGDGVLDVREHRLLYTESLRQQKASAAALVSAHYAALTDALVTGRAKYARSDDAKQRVQAVAKRLEALQPQVTEKVLSALTANLTVSDARADKIFRAMDKDRDGRVTLEEVKALYKQSTHMGLEVSYYMQNAIRTTPFVDADAKPATASAPAATATAATA